MKKVERIIFGGKKNKNNFLDGSLFSSAAIRSGCDKDALVHCW